MNNCRKGKKGELKARHYLISLGFGDANTTRRGQQHAGGPESPDVVCESLPNVRIEVKCDQSVDLGTEKMGKVIAKAKEDAGGKAWAVLWKHDHRPWMLTFYAPAYMSEMTACGDHAIRSALIVLNK